MIASAVVMAIAGILASFIPHEILNYIGVNSTGIAPLIIQITGALYLGFAVMNWMAKGILIGGIYARPLAMGNFMHYVVSALALIKGLRTNPHLTSVWTLCAIYLIFAILFGLILFRHPVKSE